jgi:hypothetical protein
VHIVLGPDTHHQDVVRLDAMIRYTLRDRAEYTKTGDDHPPARGPNKLFNVVRQPLWAEDFLAIAQEGILTQPYWRRREPET